jgi:hypothetical protein
VHELPVHVQLLPDIEFSVRPGGRISVTVTPLAALELALLTVSVYEPVPPALKLPLCVEEIVSMGIAGASIRIALL